MSGIFAGILSWSHLLTEKDIIILMRKIWPYWDSLSNAEKKNENIQVQIDKTTVLYAARAAGAVKARGACVHVMHTFKKHPFTCSACKNAKRKNLSPFRSYNINLIEFN